MAFRRITALLLVILMLTISGCGPVHRGPDNSAQYGAPVEFEGPAHDAEVFFVNVGKADCAAVRIDSEVWLVDTGTEESFPAVFAALELMGAERIAGVILTHEHEDHIGGLTAAAQRLPVSKVYFPEYVMDRSAILSACEQAALEYETVRAGSVITAAQGADFHVLAPERQLPGDGNDDSLVAMLEVNGRRFLFTGDMQLEEDALLTASGAELKCDVLKVPNHGNPDASGEAFCAACDPLVSVISTDTRKDRDSANPRIKARLSGSEIYVTQDHPLGIRIAVSRRGEMSLSFPERPKAAEGVALSEVSKQNQSFTLENRSERSVDISRWCVYSTRGYELFVFPEGTLIAPGGTLKVACRKSPDADGADLVWDLKKAWAENKEDAAVLLDAFGSEVSRRISG